MASVVAAFMGKLLSMSALLLPFSVHSLIFVVCSLFSFFPSVSCTLPSLPCEFGDQYEIEMHTVSLIL